MSDPNVAFTLLVHPYADNKHRIVIRAFDDLGWDEAGRVKLTIEVRYAGEVIFPRGVLYGALHGTSDGNEARELAMALLMEPGEIDEDYFVGFTPAQMDFLITHAEAISCERQLRYCNPETGEVYKSGSYGSKISPLR